MADAAYKDTAAGEAVLIPANKSKRASVTSIATRLKPIHLPDGTRTFCGRPLSTVQVAKESVHGKGGTMKTIRKHVEMFERYVVTENLTGEFKV